MTDGNTGMLWDESGTEDGSESSGRLLVGTVKCGGESAAYPADISQYDSPKNPKIIGKVGTPKKVWMNVGNEDVSGSLLVGTVPVGMQNSGRMVTKCAKKAENMSPKLKQHLKLSSSSLGQECLGWDHHRQERSLEGV